MQGVGIHAHNLGTHLIRSISQIDAVTKGFTHLCLTVNAGQSLACLILGKQCCRLHQYGSIYGIEFVYDFSGPLKDYCEALKSAIATGLTSVGASTAASGEAGAQAFNGEMIGKTISFSDMEDKNVKH